MVNKENSKKAIALAFSVLVILLIFTVLIPPAAGVELTIGGRSPSTVKKSGVITFTDVNITIEAIERIPFVELNFSIFKGSIYKDSVKFNVNGTSIHPSTQFDIILKYPNEAVLTSWHTPGIGYDSSYGEYWGTNQGTGYGYGGDSGAEQITISYDIRFYPKNLAQGSGYYGKFYGNATMDGNTIIYNSTKSLTFSITSTSSSSGGGGISNTPPIADAGGPYVGSIGQTISFTAEGSTDSDGTISGYKWDFTNDGVYDTDWLSSATFDYIYDSPGQYTVAVIVKDNAGLTDSDTGSVTISGSGLSTPIANSDGPYTGVTSRFIQFDGSNSYDPDGIIVNYTWDLGDGSKSYIQNPTHLYPNEGEYTVTLTVTDNDDITDQDITLVTILMDTDGDGWSDVLEIAYGVSETDPNDKPSDYDNDGIPDEDSPDGTYIGDTDDDNDGLSDYYEELLGSDPKNDSDIIELTIEGILYYIIDTDTDGKFDTLFNSFTEETSNIKVENDSLFLDADNDGSYEYVYDISTGEASVNPSGNQKEEFPFVLVIISIVIIIIIGTIILFKTGYLYIENINKTGKKK
jgi:PKD repeat protein